MKVTANRENAVVWNGTYHEGYGKGKFYVIYLIISNYRSAGVVSLFMNFMVGFHNLIMALITDWILKSLNFMTFSLLTKAIFTWTNDAPCHCEGGTIIWVPQPVIRSRPHWITGPGPKSEPAGKLSCPHLGQWPMTYLMTLSDWTMSCQPWPPRARYGQWARYK